MNIGSSLKAACGGGEENESESRREAIRYMECRECGRGQAPFAHVWTGDSETQKRP